MPVTELGMRKLRRIVPVRYKRGHIDFDIEMNNKGLTFRRPGTTNRTKLFAPWHVILQNVRDEQKGYRIWSIEEAIGHLADVTADPKTCPCCGATKK